MPSRHEHADHLISRFIARLVTQCAVVSPRLCRSSLSGKGSVRNTRIVVTHYGGPDALQVLEEERPEPNRGEVRVKVLAAGVALPDILAREGIHPETPRVPFT